MLKKYIAILIEKMIIKKLKIGADTYEIPEGVKSYTELEDKPDLSIYETKDDAEYTKQVLQNEIDGKVTMEEVESRGYAVEDDMLNRFSSVDTYLEQLHTELEGKADTSSLPSKTSELVNDSNFITENTLEAAKQALQGEINDKVDNDTYQSKISEIEAKIDGGGEGIEERLDEHIENTTIHVTADDKANWDSKTDGKTFDSHINNTSVHVTTAEKSGWDDKYTKAEIDASFEYYGNRMDTHIADTEHHINNGERSYWNSKADANNVYTKTEVETKLNSIESKMSKTWVLECGGNIDNLTITITTEEINDLIDNFNPVSDRIVMQNASLKKRMAFGDMTAVSFKNFVNYDDDDNEIPCLRIVFMGYSGYDLQYGVAMNLLDVVFVKDSTPYIKFSGAVDIMQNVPQ